MPFSGYAEVVESHYWLTPDGRRLSKFSAGVPEGSTLISAGWDIAWTGDGTVGRCKPPFETQQEAEDFAANWNADRVAAYESAGQVAPPLP